jgi:hypothetical protein
MAVMNQIVVGKGDVSLQVIFKLSSFISLAVIV